MARSKLNYNENQANMQLRAILSFIGLGPFKGTGGAK